MSEEVVSLSAIDAAFSDPDVQRALFNFQEGGPAWEVVAASINAYAKGPRIRLVATNAAELEAALAKVSPGPDLTTPFKSCGIYYEDSDRFEILLRDCATFAQYLSKHDSETYALRSMDTREIVGLGINFARSKGLAEPAPTEGAAPDEALFKVGDQVEKSGGDYTFVGEVRAAFTKCAGTRRYVVENEAGLCHIFNEGQLVSREPEGRT